jgi:rhodanese-related sulfurtransferase
MMNLPEITVEELSERLTVGGDLQLVDVREPQELALAALPGFVNLPLSGSPPTSTPPRKPSCSATTACDRPRCVAG